MTIFGIEISSPFGRRIQAKCGRRLGASGSITDTLAHVPPGFQAVVTGFMPGISPNRYTHLRAYGLAPGCRVFVIQHSPVTVIRIDHLELALEKELAEEIKTILVK